MNDAPIVIKNRFSGDVMHTVEGCETLKNAVVKLVSERANLSGASLYGANLSGAKLNWRSHWLMAHLLKVAAADDVSLRMVAGLVAVSTDWCWDKLLTVGTDEQRDWALKTLAGYVVEGDKHPIIINRYIGGVEGK